MTMPASEPDSDPPQERPRGVSRRGLLGAAGAGVVGLGLGAAGGVLLDRRSDAGSAAPTSSIDRAYPFYGDHQAGIVTPAQDRLHFAAFDVTTASRDELIGLLRDWTAAAARLTAGKDAGEIGRPRGPTTRRRTTPVRRSGCRPPG